MSYLVRLEDETGLDPGVVGFKFVSQARAVRHGLPVPPAVAIHTGAHRAYLQSARLPEELLPELRATLKWLDSGDGISVRSSATLEDLADRSFAGVYKSYLNVSTEEELLDKIRRCWDSAAAAVARSYLRQTDPRAGVPEMSVILQRMVPAVAAGVAFSSNPIYPSRREVVVEAVRGLGEKLVSGHVTPHRAYIGQDGRLRFDTAESSREPVPLDDESWRAVARLARAAEDSAEGVPQDIEWASDGERRIWLLQSRPITTSAPTDSDAPDGTWTRRIAVDLWADRISPFLGDHMVRNAPRFDFSKSARFTGIPVVQPSLTVIRGFLYVNCDSLAGALSVLPGKLRITDIRQLFPPGFELDDVAPPKLGKLLSVAARALIQGILRPSTTPFLCEWAARRGLATVRSRLAAIDRHETADASEAVNRVRSAAECLADLQERNQWPYLYATVFTVALRWWVVERLGLDHADFLRFLSGRGKNVTYEIERELRRIADGIRGDESLMAEFRDASAEELVAGLGGRLREELAGFLGRYGCRSPQRSLYAPRWEEAPRQVIAMIQTLLRQPEKTRAKGQSPVRRAGEVLAGASLPSRWTTRPLVALARRYLDLREDLRFALDGVLYRLRLALLDLGRITELGDDVFFLKLDELKAHTDGRIGANETRRLAHRRRVEFESDSEPHTFWVDGRGLDDFPGRANLLRGLGASPGRAVGRARIVDDPADAEIRDGDILVATNTDPGWTPILSVVGGVVVEEGGLLNHSSIVARELGIPAVVGIRRATRRIPDGSEITVDGDLGVVQIAPSQTV
jgi:pyruvate,water dikinase